MTNYDTIAEEAKARFLCWDQEEMIGKFGVKADENYFYLSLCGAPYRIDRATAVTERLREGKPVQRAGFREALSLFDLLCYGKEGAALAGTWVSSRELGYRVANTAGSRSFFAPYEKKLQGHGEDLRAIFQKRGYTPFYPGDAGCIFPAFDILPAVFQYWEGDGEFPATLKFLWDENTLDFLHFETAFHIATFWLDAIMAEVESA